MSLNTVPNLITREKAELIRKEMKESQTNDFLSDYLRTLDNELETIDKRMRKMMTDVESHSRSVHKKAFEDNHKIKPIPKFCLNSPKVFGQEIRMNL
jgi:hypothetical protein